MAKQAVTLACQRGQHHHCDGIARTMLADGGRTSRMCDCPCHPREQQMNGGVQPPLF